MVSSSAKRACHGRDPPGPGFDIMGLPCPPSSRPWDCVVLCHSRSFCVSCCLPPNQWRRCALLSRSAGCKTWSTGAGDVVSISGFFSLLSHVVRDKQRSQEHRNSASCSNRSKQECAR